MKAAIISLGCKVNQYDATAMRELLMGAGYEMVPFDERADVYIVNTCTVTNVADKKSRNMIRRAKKANGDAIVCVCGCLPQKEGAGLLSLPGVDALVGTSERGRIVEIIQRCRAGEKVVAVPDINEVEVYENADVKTSGELTRGYVKVQDGCDHFCSYCILPYVRGKPRSRKISSVLQEVERLENAGISEVVLTGINLSVFGRDTGESLAELIKAVGKMAGIRRVRLGSLSPTVLTEDFIREIAQVEKLCPHFHVSLQSGCDSVLARMNRKYTTGDYEAAIRTLRRHFEKPAITTDIITGFPGETEEEFAQTCAFTEKIGFARLHVFPYSEREGTAAASMEDAVDPALRRARAQVLIGLGKKLQLTYTKGFIGSVQEVLLEQPYADGYMEGYTDRYLRVFVPQTGEKCVKALLIGVKDDIIKGEVIN